SAVVADSEVVGRRDARRSRGIRTEAGPWFAAPRSVGGRGARGVRGGVRRGDAAARRAGSARPHAKGVAAAVAKRRKCRSSRFARRMTGPLRGRRRQYVSVMAVPDSILEKIPHLPESPGVYLWRDADGNVLYVGKAKRLRSRVRSYIGGDIADS